MQYLFIGFIATASALFLHRLIREQRLLIVSEPLLERFARRGMPGKAYVHFKKMAEVAQWN
jgi:hypothetical protein